MDSIWIILGKVKTSISVLHMVSNYYLAHLITISDVDWESIQNIDYFVFCHFEGFFYVVGINISINPCTAMTHEKW